MKRARYVAALQALALSYVLMLVSLALHEVGHLVVLSVWGKTGVLVVVPWRLGSMDYYIYGLHVESTRPLPAEAQALLNFLGPALASLPLLLLVYYVRETIPRAALTANVLILIFFAVLESSYVLLEHGLQREIGVLGSPEFNIGIPVLVAILVVYFMVWKKG